MPRAGLTTAKVVRAGADLADEIGFDAVTVSAIARSFDVKVASLYSHVAGSDDLRRRMALDALADLADRLATQLAGTTGVLALRTVGDVHRDYAATHPGRYDAARHRLPPDVAAASAGPQLAELMRTALRGYDMTEPNLTHAVRMLGSLVHGFVDLERSGGFSHSLPASQDSWEAMFDGLDVLLRTWAGSRTAECPAAPRG